MREISLRIMFTFLCLFFGEEYFTSNLGNKIGCFFAAPYQLPTVTDHPRREDGEMDKGQLSHTLSSATGTYRLPENLIGAMLTCNCIQQNWPPQLISVQHLFTLHHFDKPCTKKEALPHHSQHCRRRHLPSSIFQMPSDLPTIRPL